MMDTVFATMDIWVLTATMSVQKVSNSIGNSKTFETKIINYVFVRCIQVFMASIAWNFVRVHHPNLFVTQPMDVYVGLDSLEPIVLRLVDNIRSSTEVKITEVQK